MKASIVKYPESFDRVDLIKLALADASEPTEAVQPGDSRLWILGSPLVVEVNGRTHEVPTGFTTDGASIPRWGQFLTGWDPWEEPQRWGAIVHDWLYCERNTIKQYCDKVFREVLRSEGSNSWQHEIMYLAVMIGGGKAYQMDQASGPQIYV